MDVYYLLYWGEELRTHWYCISLYSPKLRFLKIARVTINAGTKYPIRTFWSYFHLKGEFAWWNMHWIYHLWVSLNQSSMWHLWTKNEPNTLFKLFPHKSTIQPKKGQSRCQLFFYVKNAIKGEENFENWDTKSTMYLFAVTTTYSLTLC